MSFSVAVRVPASDLNDLREMIAAQGDTHGEIQTARPFDGETVVQVVVLLTGAGYPVFRTWLKSRTDSRKTYSIIHNGTELRGYTPKEAERVINALDQIAANDVPESADEATRP